MAPAYWEVQNSPKVHEGDIELDEEIIAQLPSESTIKNCRGHGASNWNTTARIDTEKADGESQSYFLKLTDNPNGGPMFEGEFESMKLINQTVPEYAPKPLAWGKCSKPNQHFILFEFHGLQKGPPSVARFTNAVVQLHSRSLGASPTGKFGFHMNTYNGTLEQTNDWTDSWESFYIRGMQQMLKLDRKARGPSAELEKLSGPFLEKVIPRLLRPLQTKGRNITPVLIHGDLWLGNVSVQDQSGEPLMFDASAFWGHNEYELPSIRLLENDWAKECMRSYHDHIPVSEPVDDWDARSRLYAM
ncbi:hypothetical protein PMIN03_009123 [Paraphaeosphaeria minitans]